MGILQYFVSNAPPGHQGAVLNGKYIFSYVGVTTSSLLARARTRLDLSAVRFVAFLYFPRERIAH